MIEIHLYGKLRRFAENQDPAGDSIIYSPVQKDDTIQSVLERLGIPLEEIGSNIFLNWQYSALTREIGDNDRLAVFPDDMQLLYKWYFTKEGNKDRSDDPS